MCGCVCVSVCCPFCINFVLTKTKQPPLQLSELTPRLGFHILYRLLWDSSFASARANVICLSRQESIVDAVAVTIVVASVAPVASVVAVGHVVVVHQCDDFCCG